MPSEFEGFSFTVDSALLAADIAAVARSAESSEVMPILQCVNVVAEPGVVIVECTDLETRSQGMRAGGEVLGAGGIAVPAKRLCRVLEALPGPVTVHQASATELTVTSERTKASVAITAAAGEFPEWPSFPSDPAFSIPARLISRAARDILHCISTEESRFQLNGAEISVADGRLWLVATDGHRLGASSCPVESGTVAAGIVSHGFVRELSLLPWDAEGDVSIFESTTHVKAEFGALTLVSRKLEGKFPEWRKVRPEQWATVVTLSRGRLIEAMDLCKAAGARVAKFDLSDGELRIFTDFELSSVSSTANLSIYSWHGGNLLIGLARKYVKQAAEVGESPAVEIRLNSPNSQILVGTPGQIEERWEIVMPVDLNRVSAWVPNPPKLRK